MSELLMDLASYVQEVQAFAHLADDFIDKASSPAFAELVRRLEASVVEGRPEIVWETAAPIRFRPTRIYDGPGREQPPTTVDWSFECIFQRNERARKSVSSWYLTRAVTHIQLECEGGISAFHFDLKNPGQWGPQLHFQISEGMTGFGVPRIASAAFLPTDCADLVLAELFPEEWVHRQRSQHGRNQASLIRDAQENRTISFVREVFRQWDENRDTTRFAMLQNYSTEMRWLPNHRGREPVAP